jgi:hypothetical protein
MEIRTANINGLGPLFGITQRCIKNLHKQGIYQLDEIYPLRKDFQDDIAASTLYAATSGQRYHSQRCRLWRGNNYAPDTIPYLRCLIFDTSITNQGREGFKLT